MVFNDLYNIAPLVKDFDPRYQLVWNEEQKRHQVIVMHRKPLYEGVLDGHPLYVLHDAPEVVLTWEHDCPPDMRMIRQLYESDVWRYPGGPAAFYDDMVARSEKVRAKRESETNDFVEYTANEYAPYVANELQGLNVKRVHTVGV